MMFISCFNGFSFAFLVRNGGQGVPVRLGLHARLISSLLLFLLRRNRSVSALRCFSPCRRLLVLHKNGAVLFV